VASWQLGASIGRTPKRCADMTRLLLCLVCLCRCVCGRYCCDNSSFPCTSPSSCAGNRAGPLCGDCAPGFVETMGSSQCGPVSNCPQDRKIVWLIVAVVLLFLGVVHLTFVSGVGLSREKAPSGRLKLAIYYAQVWESVARYTVQYSVHNFRRSFGLLSHRVAVLVLGLSHRARRVELSLSATAVITTQMSAYVVAGFASTSNVAEAIYSVLRMQPPSVSSVVGLCITSDLTATTKISMSAGLQLCVALAMIVVYLVGIGGTACRNSKKVRLVGHVLCHCTLGQRSYV
jgi:hypothetical protein